MFTVRWRSSGRAGRGTPSDENTERVADMARFTHHQPTDRYDVLPFRPQKLARGQALDDDQFNALQELLRRFYRVAVFGSAMTNRRPTGCG